MSEETIATNTNSESRSLAVLKVLLKPIEYGLIGFALILVLFSAQKLKVLPKTFKGFGVEIEIPQEQADVIQESFSKIATLEADVAKLRRDLATFAKTGASVGSASELTAEQIEEPAQDTLVTPTLVLEKKNTQSGLGYIWIGTYNQQGVWTESSVAAGDKLATLPPPSELKGKTFRMRIDTNLRDDAPQDNDTYFKNTKRLGFVPAGTSVFVHSSARTYDRAGVTQVWVEVDTDFKPV